MLGKLLRTRGLMPDLAFVGSGINFSVIVGEERDPLSKSIDEILRPLIEELIS
jgi:hypothetical protein